MRSLPRHVDDIVSDNRIINSNITGFKETQIKSSDSTCKIIEMLKLPNINLNKNEDKLLHWAYSCRNDVAVLNKFDANGVSILSFKKHAFANRVFTLMLVYRKQSTHMKQFFSDVAIFTGKKFHRYYSRELQLWSFKSIAK